MDVEAVAAGLRGDVGGERALGDEDGDLVFVDGEEELGYWFAVEVGEVCAFEGRVGGQGCGVGKVEAEGETALEPGFYCVTIGGDDLWGCCGGEGGEVLVKEFCGEGIGLMELPPAQE